jgi:hypothetical protein
VFGIAYLYRRRESISRWLHEGDNPQREYESRAIYWQRMKDDADRKLRILAEDEALSKKTGKEEVKLESNRE